MSMAQDIPALACTIGAAIAADDAPRYHADKSVPALSRLVTLLFAAACGLAVANIYYAQPLLAAIANEFGMSRATAGIIITATQIGYGVGLLLVVPLGDLLDRRNLIVGQSLLLVLALLGVAVAPTGATLLCAMAAVGVLAVVTQVMVAYAAGVANPGERGRVVGIVTTESRRADSGTHHIGHPVGSLRVAFCLRRLGGRHVGRRIPAICVASTAGEPTRKSVSTSALCERIHAHHRGADPSHPGDSSAADLLRHHPVAHSVCAPRSQRRRSRCRKRRSVCLASRGQPAHWAPRAPESGPIAAWRRKRPASRSRSCWYRGCRLHCFHIRSGG